MSAARYAGFALSLGAVAALRLARLTLGRERFERVEARAVAAAAFVLVEVKHLRALPGRVERVEALAARLATSEGYHARMGVDTVSRLGALEARDVIGAADLATALREAVEAFDAKHPPPPGVGPYGVSVCPSHGDLCAALERAAVIRRERVEAARAAGRGS